MQERCPCFVSPRVSANDGEDVASFSGSYPFPLCDRMAAGSLAAKRDASGVL